STQKTPFGFPALPSKWTITSIIVASAVSLTVPGGTQVSNGLSLAVPIGAWSLAYKGTMSYDEDNNGSNGVVVALSTNSTDFSDGDLRTRFENDFTGATGAFSTTQFYFNKDVELTAETTYYGIHSNLSGGDTITLNPNGEYTLITARCNYL